LLELNVGKTKGILTKEEEEIAKKKQELKVKMGLIDN